MRIRYECKCIRIVRLGDFCGVDDRCDRCISPHAIRTIYKITGILYTRRSNYFEILIGRWVPFVLLQLFAFYPQAYVLLQCNILENVSSFGKKWDIWLHSCEQHAVHFMALCTVQVSACTIVFNALQGVNISVRPYNSTSLITVITQLHTKTFQSFYELVLKKLAKGIAVQNLYLGGTPFESSTGLWTSRQTLLWSSSVLPGRCWIVTWAMSRSLIKCYLEFVIHSESTEASVMK